MVQNQSVNPQPAQTGGEPVGLAPVADTPDQNEAWTNLATRMQQQTPLPKPAQ